MDLGLSSRPPLYCSHLARELFFWVYLFRYWLSWFIGDEQKGGSIWPWLAGFGALAFAILLALFQVPQTADRLNPQGDTGFLRLNLWQASLNMFQDHPIIGVGLDNFLYEYRGRYLLDAAWKEPNPANHGQRLPPFVRRQ